MTDKRNKRHIKDRDNDVKNEEKTGSKSRVEFFIQKTEKIASVVYAITDLFDDRETLKWELRRQAVSSVSLLYILGGRVRDPAGTPSLAQVNTALEELIVLLDIAAQAYLVSDMNFAILERELCALQDALEVHARYAGFRTEVPVPAAGTMRKESRGAPRVKDINVVKDNNENKGHEYKTARKNNSGEDRSRKGHEKAERKEAIIQFLRANEEANIKDILKVISGASEKTVQRELKSLISEGVVRKEGERRWSVYSLA